MYPCGLLVTLGTPRFFGSYRGISPLTPLEGDGVREKEVLVEPRSPLKKDTPFPFNLLGSSGVTMVFTVVRNDIL